MLYQKEPLVGHLFHPLQGSEDITENQMTGMQEEENGNEFYKLLSSKYGMAKAIMSTESLTNCTRLVQMHTHTHEKKICHGIQPGFRKITTIPPEFHCRETYKTIIFKSLKLRLTCEVSKEPSGCLSKSFSKIFYAIRDSRDGENVESCAQESE